VTTSLWDYYDGEPFMENPPMAIINPLKYGRRLSKGKYEYINVKKAAKKRKVTMAKRRSSKRRSAPKVTIIRASRKRSTRRAKGRRNPFPIAGVAVNPRGRRKARRNPSIMGINLPPLTQVLYAGAGFIAPPMVEGFINRFLPTEVKSNTFGRYGVKIASVLGLTFLAKQVLGANEARMVAVGGGAYVLTSAVNEFMPQLTMSAYRTGMINKYQGMNAYHSLNGAMPQLARNLPQLAAPVWGARNAAAIDSTGGVNVIAQRFRRFQ
jgi:hypothetical protein